MTENDVRTSIDTENRNEILSMRRETQIATPKNCKSRPPCISNELAINYSTSVSRKLHSFRLVCHFAEFSLANYSIWKPRKRARNKTARREKCDWRTRSILHLQRTGFVSWEKLCFQRGHSEPNNYRHTLIFSGGLRMLPVRCAGNGASFESRKFHKMANFEFYSVTRVFMARLAGEFWSVSGGLWDRGPVSFEKLLAVRCNGFLVESLEVLLLLGLVATMLALEAVSRPAHPRSTPSVCERLERLRLLGKTRHD